MEHKNVVSGTFVKTPAPQVVEILALAGLDFAVIDAEHAPFDVSSLDVMALAGKASNLPLYVRLPDSMPSTILRILDLGFIGIFVPHVETKDDARNIVSRCRYKGGSRGYSGSPRSSGYGSLGIELSVQRAQSVSIVCQIESVQGVENADEIVNVKGVGGVFVGRADLALSMGLDSATHPAVLEAADRVIAAGCQAGIQVGMLVKDLEEQEQYARKGVSLFIHGSDQALLKKSASELAHR